VSDKFTKIEFSNSFSAKSLTTLFYMEIPKDFSYGGESHNFWEMVYIDKGEMICTAGKKQFILKSGELTFHKPDEYHNLSGNGRNSSNVSVLTFDCFGDEMDYFEGKIFRLNSEEKMLMSMLFSEGIASLSKENEKDPLVQSMSVKPSAPFGYRQMIKNLLEIFLIKLCRSNAVVTQKMRRSYLIDGIDTPYNIKEILDFLKNNLYGKLTVADIATHLGKSESAVKQQFSNYLDGGIIKYYNSLKIKEARRLIREGKYNMTQIAEMLCFDNPQYFSKCFKTFTNMTPSEYKRSIY